MATQRNDGGCSGQRLGSHSGRVLSMDFGPEDDPWNGWTGLECNGENDAQRDLGFGQSLKKRPLYSAALPL